MIDEIAIVSVAGVILWSWTTPGLSSARKLEEMITDLFHNVLLREGGARKRHHDSGASRLTWHRSDEKGIVVVATCDSELAKRHDFSYIAKVVASVARTLEDNESLVVGDLAENINFSQYWKQLQARPEVSAIPAKPARAEAAKAPAAASVKTGLKVGIAEPEADGSAAASPSAVSPSRSLPSTAGMSKEERIALKRELKRQNSMGSKFGQIKASGASAAGAASPKRGASGKKHGPAGSMGSRTLDRSLSYNPAADAAADAPVAKAEFGRGDVELRVSWVDDSDEGPAGAAASGGAGSWFAGTAFGRALSVFRGGHVLTEADLDQVGDELMDLLRTKNVTGSAAEDIITAVKAGLVGTTTGAFDSMLAVVRDALRSSIRRLLTPRTRVDPIADARANAARRADDPEGFRPYVIVFTGINGVGKSTSLSKVVYHLKDSGLTPMVAACDTFRSGAVEQLRKHTDALGVKLFDRGYDKEPAAVARSAIAAATEQGCDVVCVDTAGRMQGNRTLMQELATLVAENSPDLVLFVGEALVGTDGVNQLVEFNRALTSYAPSGTTPHGIDGIFLTKCDTIDDKIGAAVSMVHETSAPIVFMGTGQRYPDMKRLNVDYVVQSIMK